MTKVVVPVKSFRRSDTREQVNSHTGPIELEDNYAADLIKNGLAIETAMAPAPTVKSNADGAKSSASPAAPVSVEQTSNKLKDGDSQKPKTGFMGRTVKKLFS